MNAQAHFRHGTVSLRPNMLRLAIMSAWCAYAATLAGQAQASCNQGVSAGDRYYYICQGADGVDGSSSEKAGTDGESFTINQSGSLTTNASSSLSYPVTGNVPGVLMGYSRGGLGVDEASGGDGGEIRLSNSANITLEGTVHSGYYQSLIAVTSIGGNGDDDNDNNNSNGGSGGNGQALTITNNGTLTINGSVQPYTSAGGTTTNVPLFGISAVTGGGTGGSQNDSILDDQAGGSGGDGGTITLTNNGAIRLGSTSSRLTGYARGAGIHAESYGGSGGADNGGAGDTSAVTVTNTGAIDVVWNAQGGNDVYGIHAISGAGDGSQSWDDSDPGGRGGFGGTVWVTTRGSVLLDVGGSFSGEGAGIAALSRGGKGGTGPEQDHTGGIGGIGNSVVVELQGDGTRITTHGDNLYGILAQSLGGEGGDGGDGAALAGQGGGAGYGGSSSEVRVSAGAGTAIQTTGHFATGILAQSIGGGGGTGGTFVSVLGGQAGNGGSGGDASSVVVDAAGSIVTGGDHAYGVLAQSIAGSGGAGGVDVSGLVALGGDGAGGGAAGDVTVTQSGEIATTGYSSHGMLAQSIGGGGGAAGSAIGALSIGGSASGTTRSQGANVTIDNIGTIRTSGDASAGILAQSIGGGGGSGGDSIGILGVGGDGAAGGDGGSIVLQGLGTLSTSGRFSPGVLAQSIGGGGGNGGDTHTGSAGVSIAIGGSGSGGGNGGSICMGNAGACGNASPQGMTLTTRGDYSPGIVAQNIGGGGGSGGSVTNFGLASFAALQLGGSAGAGGHAGANGTSIEYTNLNILTGGSHAAGILAQSIGGGGGTGGDANNFDITVGLNAAVVVGGSGGNGGTGANSRVVLRSSQIATGMDYQNADPATYAPNDSFGILAQTIGGGGGNGGSATASDLVIAIPPGSPEFPPLALNFQAAIGGKGGSGGHACASGDGSCVTEIALLEGTSVTTLGDGSHAVVAQSIGGGGGNGGDSSVLSANVGYGDSLTGTLGMALGGTGGNASNGGKVLVQFGTEVPLAAILPARVELPLAQGLQANLLAPASTILTYGDFANGMLAQSVGGGGGNGGVGSSDAYSVGGFADVALTIGLGGAGGGGGQGGEVDVYLGAPNTIQTVGSGSRGMVAQSIGGGGGTAQGGTMSVSGSVEGIGAKLTLGVGQTGGGGGNGGAIKAGIAGAIRTQGGDADGVVLQSIGGGGGVGGSIGADSSSRPIIDRITKAKNTVNRITDADSMGYHFEVDVGGRGGTGGAGGGVDVDFSGKIATEGDWADGIVAQSIGGGGGAGGSSSASGSDVFANIDIAIGGAGGTAGNGGTITANFDGSYGNGIWTDGYNAYGVLLQSIGGGGGQGGDGSDTAKGSISVGGSAGGSGGASGVGGTIQSSSASWLAVQTTGSDAPALVAQSIGGGGGIGGAGNSDSASRGQSHEIALSVGGHGGTGNHGGTVDMTIGSSATTHGDRSHGFVVQSIGAGGGIGGAGQAGNLASVGLGGRGGAGGDGGRVTFSLRSGSQVTTTGAGAHAIVAQSIGGGGGIAGDSSVSLGLTPAAWAVDGTDTGGQGNGNVVTVKTDGVIKTLGRHAYGIVAQSIGGGGGLGGSADGGFAGTTGGDSGHGRGGQVVVDQSGTIDASGDGSTGIFAQSTGPDGGDLISLHVRGTVKGGSGSGSSIWIADGYQNTITVEQDAVIYGAASGVGVRYDGQGTNEQGATLDINLLSNGEVHGNVLCQNASGATACHMYAGNQAAMKEATLYQAHVDNGGLLEIGRTGRFDTLTVTGNYAQLSSGVLRGDVDFGAMQADRMVVQGDARLDGGFDVAAVSLLPRRELDVLEVEGSQSGTLQAVDSPIFDFHVRQEGRTHHVSVRAADFDAASQGLRRNHERVAQHLQRAWDLGGTVELGPLFAVLNNAAKSGPSAYRERLTDLSPGAALAPAGQMAAGMASFTGAMMSCPVMEGGDTIGRERDCFWGQVTRRNTDHDGGDGSPGFSFDSTTYQFGGQREYKPDWFVGGSIAYQDGRLRGDSGRVGGDGDAGYAGIALKHQAGPWLYAGSIAGGYGSYRMDRNMAIDGYDRQASGSPDVYSVGARLRAARHFGLSDSLYLKPYVDFDALYTRMSGYTESGGPLSLKVDSSDQFVVSLSPMLELGGRVELHDGAVMRPYAYAGAAFLSEDSWSTAARLKGAPAGSGTFRTSLPGDHVVGRFGLGVQVTTASNLDFRLQYDGEASSRSTSHAGQLKMMYRF
ncbi:autotransporter outer membrane beta-barrel domain-containing protein [Bordetella genomosp. 13]|nr:autotransporter outer membrane beta-barrel domain-containing protein [Bordetella genomosp. 13]